jgi:hypothetical protein
VIARAPGADLENLARFGLASRVLRVVRANSQQIQKTLEFRLGQSRTSRNRPGWSVRVGWALRNGRNRQVPLDLIQVNFQKLLAVDCPEMAQASSL